MPQVPLTLLEQEKVEGIKVETRLMLVSRRAT